MVYLKQSGGGAERPRVIVVGAGPGGLATAMLLAARGVEVEVVERMESVGGRTSAIEEDGFTFDTGPTFFLYPRLLAELFETVGARLEDEVELVKLDPHYRLVFENGPTLDASSDLDVMEREVAKISPADAKRLRDYLGENSRKLELLKPVLGKSFDSWLDLIDPALVKALPAVRPWASLDQDLKRFFRDPRTRLAFSFQSKYLGMSPYQLSESVLHLQSFLEYEHGVWHPHRWMWSAVTQGDGTTSLERLGVDVPARRGGRGNALRSQGHRPVGVRTNSKCPSARGRGSGHWLRLRQHHEDGSSLIGFAAELDAITEDRVKKKYLLLDLHDVPRHRRSLR